MIIPSNWLFPYNPFLARLSIVSRSFSTVFLQGLVIGYSAEGFGKGPAMDHGERRAFLIPFGTRLYVLKQRFPVVLNSTLLTSAFGLALNNLTNFHPNLSTHVIVNDSYFI